MERNHKGTFHVGGPVAVSRLEMFKTLVEEMTSAMGTVDVNLVPCSIHDFPTAEPRPLDVSMRTDKVAQVTGITFRDVASSCRDLINAAPSR